MKPSIKTATAIFFLATATVAAYADDGSDRERKGDDSPSHSSSLPAPDFNWITFGTIALGCSVVMLRRKYTKSH